MGGEELKERPNQNKLKNYDKKMKMQELQTIEKRLKRTCSICGAGIRVLVYNTRQYRGGHNFFRGRHGEYWECPKCYWNHRQGVY
ncbi:hypothetical protein D4R52_00895 [bacterium]|nr:MAG: hypothetical protein D4R52_00895 [bacterium]